MFSFIGNVVKGVASVAIAPVALVVDVVTLPSAAYDEDAFRRTGDLLNNAGDCFTKAVKAS